MLLSRLVKYSHSLFPAEFESVLKVPLVVEGVYEKTLSSHHLHPPLLAGAATATRATLQGADDVCRRCENLHLTERQDSITPTHNRDTHIPRHQAGSRDHTDHTEDVGPTFPSYCPGI